MQLGNMVDDTTTNDVGEVKTILLERCTLEVRILDFLVKIGNLFHRDKE